MIWFLTIMPLFERLPGPTGSQDLVPGDSSSFLSPGFWRWACERAWLRAMCQDGCSVWSPGSTFRMAFVNGRRLTWCSRGQTDRGRAGLPEPLSDVVPLNWQTAVVDLLHRSLEVLLRQQGRVETSTSPAWGLRGRAWGTGPWAE